ncbi:MAG: putative DNA-binding domain-containing protein [Deltaproteobacteria bacterium]|nr:putative DNA-binding domain-containing protein [Deltaproteobacteria bacterium]
MSSLAQIESLWEEICRNENFSPQGRFQTYRQLVKNGFLNVLKNLNPVANEILSEEEWEILYWDFVKKAPPRSSILRELPQEFSQYLKKYSHPLEEKYPYLGELIEYEYLEVEVRYAPNRPKKMQKDLVYLNPAHALGVYQWPVHFIEKQKSDPTQLPQGRYYLFLWRQSKDYEVKFMEVNPLVASLITLLEKMPLPIDKLISQVAEEHDISLSEQFIQEAQNLIIDLISKEALLTKESILLLKN